MKGGDSLHKKLKITFNAPVTLGFVIICFIATLLGVISNGRITQTVFMTYHSSLTNPMTYVRFITHIFGHSGWSHFIGNAAYLLLLGPMLEEKHGSKELIEVIDRSNWHYCRSYWISKLYFLLECGIVRS